MAKIGAQPGNNNAGKNKDWATALAFALKDYKAGTIKQGKALREIGKKLVELALDGDMAAIKEIGDRIDGKPHATIGHSGGISVDHQNEPISSTTSFINEVIGEVEERAPKESLPH